MATATIKEKVECDLCDGCGWYEGGPYLKNRCNNCGGTGLIEVEREVKIKHKYKKGEWVKSDLGRGLMQRTDVCELCGCKREITSGILRGRPYHYTQYNRSKMWRDLSFECWGAKNPI